jgi:signal transduction histidine kinase
LRRAAALRSPLVGLALGALVVAGIALILYPLTKLDPGVSSGVLYILGVLLLTISWGLWLGLLTSVASAAAVALLHGGLDSSGDVAAICVQLLTAVIASVIADRARLRAEDAEERLRLEEELREREAERIRLDELRASRARVIAAADEERRRVVRDLHDGAQQRLVNTVVTLRLARRAMGRRDFAATEQLVDEALDHAGGAKDELRELAHGILPAALTRGGLQAGIETLVARMPLTVTVDVAVDRLAPEIEAPAYFVVAEALTNVVKHAYATTAAVSARAQDGALRLTVRDDGVGGATLGGSGLIGLEDRLAAIDGALRIDSPRDGGTLVAATIPLSRGAATPPRAPVAAPASP